jgi:uncharacterized protein YcbK (DUF882 family)
VRVDRFLRDHRTGDVHHYDPRLLDLLSELEASVGRPNAEIVRLTIHGVARR